MSKPLPDKIRISFPGGAQVAASIRQNARARRLIMRLEPGGTVVISVPYGTKMAEISEFTRIAAPRLQKALAGMPAEKAAVPEHVDAPLLNARFLVRKSLFDGQPPYSGEGNASHARLEGNEIFLSGPDEKLAMLVLQEFFLKLAARPLTAYIQKVAPADVLFSVSVRNQRKRMGSCSRKILNGARSLPAISLNWRAILLPVPLLRHLCMHEIAHISHMNHSGDFYEHLETLSPSARLMERKLNEAWRALPPWVFHRE